MLLQRHFRANALSALSVTFALDLIAWPPHRIITRAPPASASAKAKALALACDSKWLRLNCIIFAVRELAAKMCRTSKTATTTQLLRIILALLVTTNMAFRVVFTTIHAPRMHHPTPSTLHTHPLKNMEKGKDRSHTTQCVVRK